MFLVEDGRFDCRETESLLGVKTRQFKSYPVGFERRLQTFPLDFEEFSLVNGVQPRQWACRMSTSAPMRPSRRRRARDHAESLPGIRRCLGHV